MTIYSLDHEYSGLTSFLTELKREKYAFFDRAVRSK